MSEGKILTSDRCGSNSSNGRCGMLFRGARVQVGVIQGRRAKWVVFGLKTGQRRDVRGNVATFQRGKCSTSRRSGQCRDVPENGENQRRDVGDQRRDVPERFKINVATLNLTLRRSRKG